MALRSALKKPVHLRLSKERVVPMYLDRAYRLNCTKFDKLARRKITKTVTNCCSVGWPFTMLQHEYIFQIIYTEAVSSNSTRKLLWFEISKMLITA